MRKSLISRAVAVALLLANAGLFPLNLQASAASPYSGKPTNIETLKNRILDALFTVNYGGKTDLAFAGNYTLSQSSKDDGYESLLITSRDYLNQCYYESISNRTLKLAIENRGKTYKGTCWGFGLEYVDMATIATPFKSPTLPLWDSYLPQPGGWLIAVYFVPGFGITFKETTVGIVNKQSYVMGVEKFSPAPTGSALLFNQDGSFVGILTSKGVGTVPSEYFKAHGAPLQCSPASTEGSAITNCSTRKSINESAQDGVWTIDETKTPTPTPTPVATPRPSPSISAVDASLEVRDAYASTLNAYKLYTGKVVSCLEAFKGRNASEQKLLSIVSGSQICTSENSTAKSANDRTLSLGQTISSSRDPLGLITQFNNLTDTFNISTIAIDDAILMAKKLAALYPDFESLENSLLVFNDQLDSLDYIFENLPLKVTSLIKKGIAFDYLEEYRELVADAESQFDAAQGEIDGITYPDPEAIDNFGDTLKVLLRGLPSETIFSRTVGRAMSAIPAFYCKKGSSVALPKKGKCASGFARIMIDKG